MMARYGKLAAAVFLTQFLVGASADSSSFLPRKIVASVPARRALGGGNALLSTRGGGKSAEVVKQSKKASMSASTFNLVNNVAGAGILTLAAGKAKGTGWIPALAIVSLLGLGSAHTFNLVGKACDMTGATDFKGLWAKTLGPNTTYLIDLAVTIQCFASSIVYCGILGDVWTPIFKSAGLPDSFNLRKSNIVVLTACVLYPLSLIKDLSSLAFTSVLGFSAVAYTVLFLVIRALDGTYSFPLGKFVTGTAGAALPALPSFDKSTLWNLDFSSLILMASLGLAFIAHYNAPIFYNSLEDKTTARFKTMVGRSYAVLVALYCTAMSAGYATFGDVSRGNILLNYHPTDILAGIARVATGFSILFGFPLVFSGGRRALTSVASTLGVKAVADEKNHAMLVTALLSIIAFIATNVEDISIVVGLSGASLGSLIVYILPTLLYTKAVKLASGENSPEYRSARVNLAFVPFGMFIAGMGVFMTLKGN